MNLCYSDTINLNNDSPLRTTEISQENLNALVHQSLQQTGGITDKLHKGKQVALYCYEGLNGLKGRFRASQLGFIDLDTTELVDEVFTHTDEIFAKIPNILFLQKSFSGKLHIVYILATELITDEIAWSDAHRYTVAGILYSLKRLGFDYFKVHERLLSETGSLVIDAHSLRWNQALYLSHYPVVLNPYPTAVKFDFNSDIAEIYEKYTKDPVRRDKISKTRSLTPGNTNPNQDTKGDWFLNGIIPKKRISLRKADGVVIAGCSGNELRYKMFSVLWYHLGSREAAIKAYDALFTRDDNHLTDVIYGVRGRREFEEWILENFGECFDYIAEDWRRYADEWEYEIINPEAWKEQSQIFKETLRPSQYIKEIVKLIELETIAIKRSSLDIDNVDYTLRCKEYISNKIDAIVAQIRSSKVTIINAPTGAGKTTLFNGKSVKLKELEVEERKLNNILTQYTIDEIYKNGELYEEYLNLIDRKMSIINENVRRRRGSKLQVSDGLAYRLNAVILSIFNATSLPYTNVEQINSRLGNIRSFSSKQPCVLIPDQLVKIPPERFKGRTVIIDEFHLIFEESRYREIFSKLDLSYADHIVLVSATPYQDEELITLFEMFNISI